MELVAEGLSDISSMFAEYPQYKDEVAHFARLPHWGLSMGDQGNSAIFHIRCPYCGVEYFQHTKDEAGVCIDRISLRMAQDWADARAALVIYNEREAAKPIDVHKSEDS